MNEARNETLDQLEAQLLERKIKQLDMEIAAQTRLTSKVMVESDQTGKFLFLGDVEEGRVHSTMLKIDSFRARNPGQPVEILMNSGGGSVVDGLALIDYLKRIQREGTTVRIIATGLVASMAGIILQAADERVITPRCFLGMHEVSSGTRGSISVQEDAIKFAKELQKIGVALLCEKSTLTPTKLKNMWERRDVYVNATEALKLGLVDKIEEV